MLERERSEESSQSGWYNIRRICSIMTSITAEDLHFQLRKENSTLSRPFYQLYEQKSMINP